MVHLIQTITKERQQPSGRRAHFLVQCGHRGLAAEEKAILVHIEGEGTV